MGNKKPHPPEMRLPGFMPVQSKWWCRGNLPGSVLSFTICWYKLLWSYVLYWAQPFVAKKKKKAHGLCWSIRLVKRTVLKEPPASKCWNKWVSAWTYERAGLCLSLALKAHPVIYCDGWGIKSSFLDFSLLVISGPKSTAMHVLEVLFKGVADRISHGDWGKNLQKQTCSQQRKFWCCCWLVGWLVLLLWLF